MLVSSSRFVERAPSFADAALLRPLASSDSESAAAVIRAAFAAQSRATNPPSSALRETTGTVAAKIAAGGGFGAFADGRLVALALWQEIDGALMIARVAVLPEARGRGLSRQVIEACEAEARARGLSRARLRVRLMLPENERLFERMGFARSRIEAHEGFDAPTVAVLEKPLC